MLDQDDVRRFRAEVVGRRNLPTIPTVVAKILALVDAEHASARQLVDVIEHDQALTARTLRLANSAFFGQQRQVATIPRALLVLGFSTVRNLALGVKVWDALAAGVARRRVEALWKHAVTVASLGRRLASQVREGDPDETFTAGLLHDVGRVVIASRFGEEYWQAVEATDEVPTDVRERERFGIDHAEVGGWLLEAWNLPQGIVDAVRAHHDGESRPGTPRILWLTNRLVHATDLATGTTSPSGVTLLGITSERGFDADAWQQLVTDARLNDALSGLGAPGA